MKSTLTPNAPQPAGHYAQAIVHNGLIFVSGQLPIDPQTGQKRIGSIEEQTEQALKNVAGILRAAGSDTDHILKTTVYIADIDLWDRVNAVYARFLGDHRPARAVVPTKNLHFGFQIEIEAIATVKGQEDEEPQQIPDIVRRALQEDIGRGDVTSQWTMPAGLTGRGTFYCKAPGILAGMAVAREVFAQVSSEITLTPHKADGDAISPGDRIATVAGPMAAILTAERTALNLMQRMSGIATLTAQYIQAIAGTGAIILDTRKTVPGLRPLDKWAVRLGGGQNHRMRLDDMVLIKDNHIAAAGSITAALQLVRAHNDRGLPVEVEVKTWAELEEAVALQPDRIMLDNMPPVQMGRAVQWVAGRVPLEASGGITLETVRAVAETGVDFISVGALTHSVHALDISLEIEQTHSEEQS